MDTIVSRRQPGVGCGLEDPLAPLGSVLSTFVIPYRWPPEHMSADAPLRNLHYEVKEILGYPSAVVGKVVVENIADVVTGDHIAVAQRLASVSELKRSALGEGRFWVIERRYYRQTGELAVCESMTSFGYGDRGWTSSPPAGIDAAAEALGISKATDTTIEAEAPDWDAIEIGLPLPTLRMPITVLRSVRVTAATRNFLPIHADSTYAGGAAGGVGAIMSREFQVGIVGRFLTDWGGRRSRVRRLEIAMKRHLRIGDEMIVSGRVAGRRERGDLGEVDVVFEVRVREDVASTGTATLARSLRRRGASP